MTALRTTITPDEVVAILQAVRLGVDMAELCLACGIRPTAFMDEYDRSEQYRYWKDVGLYDARRSPWDEQYVQRNALRQRIAASCVRWLHGQANAGKQRGGGMQHGVIQPDGRLYVDNSILATEAVCQTHASLRYGLGWDLPGVRVKMNVGTAIHAGMDVFFAGGAPADVLAAFEVAYTRMGIGQAIAEMDEKQQKGFQAYTLANLRQIVSEYCRRNALLPFEVEPSTIEQGFVVLLDPEFNIWYSGTPDVGQAYMRGSRSLYVVDTKSTGSYLTAEYKRGYRTASQVTGYLWGLRETTGLPYVGAFINAINIKKIPDSNRRCSDHGVQYAECGLMHAEMELFPVSRTPQQIEAWRVNAMQLARRYRARLEHVKTAADLPMVPMEGQFAQGGGVCRQCMAADFCALGRPAAFVGSMFEQAGIWDPQAVRQPKSVLGA